jgi:hypothetical protein
MTTCVSSCKSSANPQIWRQSVQLGEKRGRLLNVGEVPLPPVADCVREVG